MPFFYFILVGIIAGIFSGLFGIGGGIIIVPILALAFGWGQLTASATSLVALLMPVGLFAVIQFYRLGKIGPSEIKFGLLISVGMFFGAFLGANLAVRLPELWLRRGFAILLLYTAFRMLTKK
jgi:uncharacterized membrane protein YfcA